MSLRQIAILVCFSMILGCSSSNSPTQETPIPALDRRPNFLVIVADDMGWTDISNEESVRAPVRCFPFPRCRVGLDSSGKIVRANKEPFLKLDRRDVLKAGALAALAPLTGSFAMQAFASKARLELKMSGYPHEHVKALMSGMVGIDGANIDFSPGKIGDINSHVFAGPREFAFTEIGLSPYIVAFANEKFRAYSLIPVFPFRTFRHKSIFVHADAGIERPADLKGRRVATPGYSSTSLTWIRGILQDEYGVKPEDVEWVLSAKDSSAAASGAISKQETVMPEGLSFSVGAEGKDESELLVDREVDALFHAAEPRAFVDRHPKVKRLFADPRNVERDYYARTGIFPVMHAVAIRNDLVDEHPWLLKAVFNAYSESKALTYADMRGKWFLRTMPWFAQELEATEALMGENFYPYGTDANRKAVETLLRYMHEQGLASRLLKMEEIFHPAALEFAEGSG